MYIRLRTINTFLLRFGVVVVVNTDDTRATGSTEFHLMRARDYPGAGARLVCPCGGEPFDPAVSALCPVCKGAEKSQARTCPCEVKV